MSFHADEVQNCVGFAQQAVGADKKIETAAKAEFSDGEAASGSITCALDEIRGLHKHPLHLGVAVGAKIDVVILGRVGLAALPADLGWGDVLGMVAHRGGNTGSGIFRGDGSIAVGNPAAPRVCIQHRFCHPG